MALAQNEAVAARPARIRRIVAHELVVENANDLDQREGRADMAAAALLDRPEDQPAQMAAACIQRLLLDRVEIGVVVAQGLDFHVLPS